MGVIKFANIKPDIREIAQAVPGHSAESIRVCYSRIKSLVETLTQAEVAFP